MTDITNIGRSAGGLKSLDPTSSARKEEDKDRSKDVPTGVRLVNENDGYSVDISPGSQGLGRSESYANVRSSDDARELAERLKNQIFSGSAEASMAQANIGPHSVLTFLK